MLICKQCFFNRLLAFFLLGMSFQSCDFLFSCQNDILHSRSGYEFEIPVALTPIKETYRIGDTISVDIDFSNEVYDRKTEQHYLMEDVHFKPMTAMINMLEVSDSSNILSSFADFEVFIPKEYNYGLIKISSGAEFLDKFYLYENNRYQLRFQIVPQKAGLYQLVHFHDYGIGGQRGREFEKQCLSVPLEAYTNLNDGHDGNIELLKESSFPDLYERNINDLEGFHDAGTFIFRVIE